MNIKVFENITNRLIENGTINAEDKEIYEYGLKHIAALFINIITTLIIGFIFGMVWQTILFMVSYIPLRSYAGGYHARTPLRCYILSIILTICVLLSIKYIPYNNMLLLIITFISGILIFMFAPVDTENKPLDDIETRVFKKRTRIILFLEVGLILFFMILNLSLIGTCFVFSLSYASFMIILGK
jgi:accessory gene regulator B